MLPNAFIKQIQWKHNEINIYFALENRDYYYEPIKDEKIDVNIKGVYVRIRLTTEKV